MPAEDFASRFSNVQVGAPAPGASDDDVGKYYDKDGNQVIGDQQDAINDLDQTISDPPTQAEVQEISDKVDTILAMLREHGLIDES